jgi:hypothetical protein
MNVCLHCRIKGIPVGYSNDIQYCKICGNESIELDDNIADLIMILNNKGYKTIHSCEGHFYSNGENSYLNGGYLTIEDLNKDIEEVLSFLPDTIGNFELYYEIILGPRSIIDRTIINKFVLRFKHVVFDPGGIIGVEDRRRLTENDFWIFQKEKVDFYKEFIKIIKTNLKERDQRGPI